MNKIVFFYTAKRFKLKRSLKFVPKISSVYLFRAALSGLIIVLIKNVLFHK
jgi:hypothetical protein